MPTPGPLELVIILVIALLILGPGKLPDVGAALGKSIREFRKASSDVQDAVKVNVETSPLPPSTTPSSTPTPNVLSTPAVPNATADAQTSSEPTAPVAPPTAPVAPPTAPVAPAEPGEPVALGSSSDSKPVTK
jgi:TatA/E family protein of Tat protein translocase